MSDKARYLLERIVNWWDDEEEPISQFVQDIRSYLAESEKKQEPLSEGLPEALRLAEELESFNMWPNDDRDLAASAELKRLYTENKKNRQNKSQPISPIEINKEYLYKVDESNLSAPLAFALGVRFAEKHHGIGETE